MSELDDLIGVAVPVAALSAHGNNVAVCASCGAESTSLIITTGHRAKCSGCDDKFFIPISWDEVKRRMEDLQHG